MAEYEFLGYKIKSENNSINLRFDEEEYKQIIVDSNNVNLTPVSYMKMLLKPCQSCGSDKIHLELIKRDMKRTSNVHSVHLFVYINTPNNKHTELTELNLDCIIASQLRVGSNSQIFTPKETHKYKDGKTDATITVFKNGVRSATINCIVKNKTIYPNEAI